MSPILTSALLGVVAGLPLLIGAGIELWRHPRSRSVGRVAAFGAGALISAVSFELVLDSVSEGGPVALAIALALGALVYYAGDRLLSAGGSAGGAARGRALMLGATLDGVPESLILGLTTVAGGGVSIPFLVAVVVSNLPEGMASTAELAEDGKVASRHILLMWVAIVAVSALSAVVGALIALQGSRTGAFAQAFAAGALLTMLVDDLIPEAREKADVGAGLFAVLGFAVAFALHEIGA